MDTIMTDLDALYDRYAAQVRAAAAEQLAAISPAATDLDEDLAEAVWDDVAAGLYPEDHRGLDGLLVLLRDQVRAVRARAVASTEAIREVVTDLDDLADEPPAAITVLRPLPATASAAVAALRILPTAV
ncbi:hypothetical protein ACIHEI_36605 [Kitasatospora sp. NPDC051984]|uniref:hypothetical protein n=1 Tax=Kitasatospora sp. NPDC051984 TaxID=3364059 RepID=UPI0037CA6F60